MVVGTISLRERHGGYQGRLVRRVGGFPNPKQAILEAPKALRQSHCLAARNVGVPPGEMDDARKVGVSLGETMVARIVGASPGETGYD